MLTVNSAKELEHFERVRRMFESTDVQKKDSAVAAQPSKIPPRTIADAVDGLSTGDEISESGTVVNGAYAENRGSKGKGRYPLFPMRSMSDNLSIRSKGKNSVSGKGKGKHLSVGAGDSDSSLDSPGPGLANGASFPRSYDDVGEDDDPTSDGVRGEDQDDYVVRTDHLKTNGDDVD